METVDPRRQYRLRRRIAIGGMAELFLASLRGAVGFDRDVVVKKIHPRWADNADVLSLFQDEARLGSRLNHPNIVQVLDYGRSGSSTYLVMEWVEGYNAADVIAAAEDALEPLSPTISVTIITEVCRALEHIHEAEDDFRNNLGIVHRDLNPANILVSFAGEVKLTDFGVAAGGHRELKTEHGILRGTFPYMSPEQTRCRPVDGRSDLFSLGICLYEMLTGRHPFADEEDYLTIERIQEEEPPRPSTLRDGIDPALDTIVMRCLAKSPGDRPQSARELHRELSAWLRRAHPGHDSTSALIRLMLHLFPRGMTAGEDVEPIDIDLGPTHPGREAPLLDVTTLERNRPAPSSWVRRRSMPMAEAEEGDDPDQSSVVRLDALLGDETVRDEPAQRSFGSGDWSGEFSMTSNPSLDVPWTGRSALRAAQQEAQQRRKEAPESLDDLDPSESMPPWDRAKILSEMRTESVLTARGSDQTDSIAVDRLPPTEVPPSRARSLLPWIALSLALALLFLSAWLANS